MTFLKINVKGNCPVCGKYKFKEIGKYEICPICKWEDDPIQRKHPFNKGGANKISLQQYRKNYKRLAKSSGRGK